MVASRVAHDVNQSNIEYGFHEDTSTYFCRTSRLRDKSIFEKMKVPFCIPQREPDFEIPGYLRRWCLNERDNEGKLGRFYLHNILGADEPFFHDHPWPFRILVLSGGYLEVTPKGFAPSKQWHIEGSTRVMDATTPHYISQVLPDTWTMIITGPVERKWGFYGSDGIWVEWDKFTEGRRDVEPIRRNGYVSS